MVTKWTLNLQFVRLSVMRAQQVVGLFASADELFSLRIPGEFFFRAIGHICDQTCGGRAMSYLDVAYRRLAGAQAFQKIRGVSRALIAKILHFAGDRQIPGFLTDLFL